MGTHQGPTDRMSTITLENRQAAGPPKHQTLKASQRMICHDCERADTPADHDAPRMQKDALDVHSRRRGAKC